MKQVRLRWYNLLNFFTYSHWKNLEFLPLCNLIPHIATRDLTHSSAFATKFLLCIPKVTSSFSEQSPHVFHLNISWTKLLFNQTYCKSLFTLIEIWVILDLTPSRPSPPLQLFLHFPPRSPCSTYIPCLFNLSTILTYLGYWILNLTVNWPFTF